MLHATSGSITARRRLNCNGFTLVEVLLALLLSSTVMVLCTTTVVQSVKMRHAAEETLRQAWQQAIVFDQLQHDLESTLTTIPQDEIVRVSDDGSFLVSVVCLAAVPSDNGVRVLRIPTRVTYIFRDCQPHSETGVLIREVRDLTKPSPPKEQILCHNVEKASVETIYGSHHSDHPGKAAIPRALRLACVFSDNADRQLSRTVILPTPSQKDRRR